MSQEKNKSVKAKDMITFGRVETRNAIGKFRNELSNALRGDRKLCQFFVQPRLDGVQVEDIEEDLIIMNAKYIDGNCWRLKFFGTPNDNEPKETLDSEQAIAAMVKESKSFIRDDY